MLNYLASTKTFAETFLTRYSYAIDVCGMSCRVSVRLSVRNGCIVAKRWVVRENFLYK